MIIGISGKKQHGKDTVAKLINYLATGGLNTYTSLGEFLQYYEDANRRGGPGYPWEVKKFADKLKQIVCLLIGCTLEQLEDNKFKETPLGEEWRIWYWIFKSDGVRVGTHIYMSEEEATFNHLVSPTIKLMSEILTPRKMLQLIGTECGREIIHPNIWVNSLMADYKGRLSSGGEYKWESLKDGNYISERKPVYPNWLVTDVRFPNEVKAITNRGGIVLRVDNPNIITTDLHPSETSLDNYTGFYSRIINDGTIENLLAKLKSITYIQRILND